MSELFVFRFSETQEFGQRHSVRRRRVQRGQDDRRFNRVSLPDSLRPGLPQERRPRDGRLQQVRLGDGQVCRHHRTGIGIVLHVASSSKQSLSSNMVRVSSHQLVLTAT